MFQSERLRRICDIMDTLEWCRRHYGVVASYTYPFGIELGELDQFQELHRLLHEVELYNERV